MAFACFYGGNCWGADEIEFTDRTGLEEKVSDNGAVTLAWANPEALEVELQQSADRSFTKPVPRYQGTDTSSVISGLAEGVHYFRVGASGADQWSAPLEIEVEFFPRNRLVFLLVTGAVVVIATIATIIGGYLNHRTGGKES